MKMRKVILLAAALFLLFGSAALANTINQNIRVFINKKEVDGGGLLVDNRAYVPVGEVAKSLQAIVVWNNYTKQASIYKPNVHMFTMRGNEAFQVLSQRGSKINFRVHVQVDNLRTEISGIKFTIEDPYGNETLIHERFRYDEDFPAGKTEFMLNTPDIEYTFQYKGAYIVRCWMQPFGDNAMQVVAEKTIIV